MNASPPYRIVFFGTSEIGVPVLEDLNHEPDFEVVLVVTRPDKPVGRHKALQAPPIKRTAETLGLDVFQPGSLKNSEVRETLNAARADAFVVISYGKILPQAMLDIPPYGAVNLHASHLPKFRGASPVAGAILAGEEETGVTVMKMNEKMDEGPVLSRSMPVTIEKDDTRASLMQKLEEEASLTLTGTLKAYLQGIIEPRPQEHDKATYTKILTREDGRVDWHESAEAIERRVRAFTPWPGSFTIWRRGEDAPPLELLVKEVEIVHPEHGCGPGLVPGRVSKLSDGGMAVDCGRGCLRIQRVQVRGKNETDGASFLNGRQEIIGSALGA